MTKDSDLIRKFLDSLASTLDLKKTVKTLDIKDEDAKAIIHAVKNRLFEPACLPVQTGAGRSLTKLSVWVDGASRGNPGISGAGAIIKSQDGHVFKKLKKSLGIQTNNGAEYMAFIMAMEEVKRLGAHGIHVFADSELLVKQLNGEYSVKSPNIKPLYKKAMEYITCIDGFKITHINREDNKEADKLANDAIDGV